MRWDGGKEGFWPGGAEESKEQGVGEVEVQQTFDLQGGEVRFYNFD